jgi:DNA-binding FrmR family transcriptional regulator
MALSLLTGREAPPRPKREEPAPEPTDLEKATAEFRQIVDGLKGAFESKVSELQQSLADAMAQAAAAREAAHRAMQEMHAAHAAEMASHQAEARADMERQMSEITARLQAAEARPAPPAPAPAAPMRLAPADYKMKVVRGGDGKITEVLMKRE